MVLPEDMDHAADRGRHLQSSAAGPRCQAAERPAPAPAPAGREYNQGLTLPQRRGRPAGRGMERILVTGGAGFIGSHIIVELVAAGYEPVIMDNLSNAHPGVLQQLRQLTGREIPFMAGDVRHGDDVERVFARHACAAVIHCAGLKAVGESMRLPLEYYDHNVTGMRVLLSAMLRHGCRCLVFSSSCTVYGDPQQVPVTERSPLQRPTSPYGETKLAAEYMARDLQVVEERLSVCLLRYFNPVGAHPSGLIGEDPCGTPVNLLPYMTQVAVGRLERLRIFGGDYPTPDGTCIRDYIHVMDLARGHVCAIRRCLGRSGVHIYNLGTGRGYSVLEVVRAFERVSGRQVPYELAPRRPGDIAQNWADASLAREELGWQAQLGLEDMLSDAWRWQERHPAGYATPAAAAAGGRT